ncbi:MAG: PEP-CTERM sorting domain-containing protein [Methylacidiphilales bacterium]|nr:PEP-CTERM sorting domain-containing protein [Candidatus Methylacidiphilales bacterium]
MKITKSLDLFQSLSVSKVVLILVFATTGLTLRAQTINASETYSYFGSLSQYNSGVSSNQATACEPTSVINGLTFLNAVNGNTVFAHSPAAYADLNSLAGSSGTSGGASGGTSYGSGVTGMVNYMSAGGFNAAPNVTISGQYAYSTWGAGLPANSSTLNFNMTTPTATFMGNALQANDAVQLAIWWGTYNFTTNTFTPSAGNGTHEIDLYSLNLTNGNGSASIVVPESSAGNLNDPLATAQNLSATIQTVAFNSSNYLYLTYGTSLNTFAGTPGETDPANGGSTPLDAVAGTAPTGIIVGDYVEAVPEPSTYVLFGLGLLVLGVMAIRRKAQA